MKLFLLILLVHFVNDSQIKILSKNYTLVKNFEVKYI